MTTAIPAELAPASSEGGTNSAAVEEVFTLQFTVDRADLARAWRRVRLGRAEDEPVTLVLTREDLVLETANAGAAPSLAVHARVALSGASRLPHGRCVRLDLTADLLEAKLCNERQHTIASGSAGSADPLVFSTPEELVIALDGPQVEGRLRVQDGPNTFVWPMGARYAAVAPTIPAPEAAVAVAPASLARAIDRARRLVRPQQDSQASARLAIRAGLAWISSHLGFCAVRRGDLAGLDLQVGAGDLAALARILAAQAAPGQCWTASDAQVLRFGDDGCRVTRGPEVSERDTQLLAAPSRAAIRVRSDDLNQRMVALLDQSPDRVGKASVTLHGALDATLDVSIPMEAGVATYTCAATWLAGTPGSDGPAAGYSGLVDVVAFRTLAAGVLRLEEVELHLHAHSLELRETADDGEMRAFVLWHDPPGPPNASDLLNRF